MRISLEDALTNAITVLQDAGQSRRMPSGVEIEHQVAEHLLDAAFEIEELRAKVRERTGTTLAELEAIAEPPYKEEALIEQAKAGQWTGEGSVSEVITVALATEQFAALPAPYTEPGAAWSRLNDRQKKIVRRHRPDFLFSP